MKKFVSLLFLLSFLASSQSLFAVTKTWIGGTGNWSNGANWNPAGAPAAGDDVVISGSLTVTLDVSPTINNFSLLVAARLIGNGDLTINGTMTWTSSEIGLTNQSNTGNLTVAGLTTLDGTVSHAIYGKNLICNGGMTINTNGVGIYGSTVTIPAGQTLTVNATGNYSLGGNGTLALSGTLEKNGTGNFICGGATFTFNHTATINVNAGTFSIYSNGTHTGTFNTAAGATLRFENSGASNFNATTFTGAGTLEFVGGTQNVNAGTTFPANSNLNLSGACQFNDNIGLTWNNINSTNSGGTYTSNQNITVNGNLTLNPGNIYGNADWTIAGTMTWTSGNIGLNNNSNTGSVTVAGLATISNAVNLYKKNLTCNGGLTFNSGGVLSMSGSPVLTIPAGQNLTVNATNTITLAGTGTLALAGNLEKNGTGSFNCGGTNLIFNHSTTVNVNAGTFRMLSSGTHTGTFNVAAGAILRFENGTSTFNATTFVAGVDALEFLGSTLNVNAGTTFPANSNLNLSGSQFNDNIGLTWNNASVSGASTYTSNQNITINGNLTLNSGNIYGNADWTIGGTMTWTSGNIGLTNNSNTGSVTVAGLVTVPNVVYLYKKNLTCNGGLTFNSGGVLSMSGSPVLTIPAGQNLTVNATGNITLSGTGTLALAGNLEKNGTGSFNCGGSNLIFNHSTTVNVNAGTFRMLSSGTHTGTFNVAAGAILRFESSTSTFNATTFVGGVDAIEFLGSTLNVNAGTTFPANSNLNLSGSQFNDNIGLTWNNASVSGASTYTSNQNITINGNLTLNSGNIYGNADWTIGGTMTWTSGNIGLTNNSNTGSVTVAGLVTVPNVVYLYKKNLTCNGGLTFNSGGVLSMSGSPVLTIPAGQNLTVNATGNITLSGTGTLALAGTLEKNGTGTFSLGGSNFTFSHSTTADVNAGMFRLLSGGTHTGTFNTAAGATTRFESNSQTTNFNAAIFTGAGTLEFAAGTQNINAGTTFPANTNLNLFGVGTQFNDNIGLNWNATTISNATYTSNQNVNVAGNFTLNAGGNIYGNGNWNITGALTIYGGQIGLVNGQNTGTVTVGGLTTVYTSVKITKKNLTCNGGLTFTHGASYTVHLDGLSTITIPSGQTFTVNGAASLITLNGHNGSLGQGGTVNLEGLFQKINNQGFTIVSNIVFNNSGTMRCDAGLVYFQTGTTFNNTATGNLIGSNTNAFDFSGNFTNNGAIAPGVSSIGTLGITRTTLPIKILNIEIAQAAPPQKDLLNITGSVDFSGGSTLNVTETQCLDDGSYTIITWAGTRTGAFSNLNLPAGYTIVYDDAQKKVNLVYDDPAPSIVCPPNVTANNDPGLCSKVNPALGTPTAMDNCPGVSTSNDGTSPYPVGTTIVNWTATDSKGQTAACGQTIEIFDNENPTITCPANILNANCSGTVNLGTPTAGDNCAAPDLTNDAPATFSGTTIVTHTATDASGNTATCQQTVTCISNCTLTVTFTAKKPTCWNSTNGTLQVNPPSPVTAYTYLWNTGATTRKILNLAAGTFTVSVTHTPTGCTTVHTYNLTAPLPPSLALTVKNSCFDQNDGSITASPTTGRTFLWSNGATTAAILGIESGTFSVTTTDTKGCTNTASATVTENPELVLSHTVQLLTNGKYKITLAASGGTAPYKYCRLNTATGACSFNNTTTYTNLLAGTTWTFRTRDAANCIVEIVVVLPSNKPAKSRDAQILEQPTVNVFPNPTENWLHLLTDLAGEKTVSIFNSTGKLMLRQPNFSGEADFQFENFQPGVYQILIENERGERLVERFLKI